MPTSFAWCTASFKASCLSWVAVWGGLRFRRSVTARDDAHVSVDPGPAHHPEGCTRWLGWVP